VRRPTPRRPAPVPPPLIGRPGHVGRRCVGFLVVVAVAFGAVVLRLGSLQVVSADEYADRGVAQRVRTVPLPAERGAILDRDGTELALSVPQHTIWADPTDVEDPIAAAEALGPVLDMHPLVLIDRLRREGRFTYLSRQRSPEVARQVSDLHLAGISSYEEPRRFLPARRLARALLGTVDLDGRGRSGLELQYQDVLAGRPGRLLVERAIDGRTIPAGNNRLEPPERGKDLVLTIDRDLQYSVEQALSAAVRSTHAEGGTVVVMDPRNGEILSMASVDADPPGTPPKQTSMNMALQSVFEPGSINKVVTYSAALEEEVVEPDTVLTVPNELELPSHTFGDAFEHGNERWPVSEVLARSSNIGTIQLAQRLGPERVDSWLRRFGLGQPTGLDFPDEANGIMRDVDDWSATSIGAIPIGQENAVNAVQMLGAFNTIANGGEHVSPSLVRAMVDADGERHDAAEPEVRRVVSEETAEQMTQMLLGVVEDEVGTGGAARVNGYRVAGKTGTARKPDVNQVGTYEAGAYMASFAGFLPAEDPQLSILVVVDEPRPKYHGGEIAAPLFASIASSALHLLRVPPTAGTAPAPVPTGPGRAGSTTD
jgi:cell division protein FtsI (penicillin-binding protein 3)